MELRVQIAQDLTKAFLSVALEEFEAEKASIKSADLENALKAAGVVVGIKSALLQEIVDKKLYNTSYEVASCIPPEAGQDARVEIIIKPKKKEDVKPVMKDDGEINYIAPREGFITLCRAGDVLARWHPPTRGNPGTGVTGKPIPGLLGREISLELFEGPNTKVEKEELIAKIDGVVDVRGTQVRVDREYILQDHVGMNTGSIELDQDIDVNIVVNGDVQRGFSVRCHSLTVSGCIEDSTIDVRRLSVKAGIVGNCKDPICADVMNLGFINGNRQIHGKLVRVLREISNGATVTGHVVTAHTIQGSVVYARDVCWTNFVNGQNAIIVGVDWSAKSEYDKLTRQLLELKAPMEELQEASYANAKKMKQLRELSKVNPKHPLLTKELPKIKELQDKLNKLKQIRETIQERCMALAQVMYADSSAFLLVRNGFSKDASTGKVIPPDTVVTIGHTTTKVTEPGGGGVFSETEHGVSQSSLFNIKELKTKVDQKIKNILTPVNGSPVPANADIQQEVPADKPAPPSTPE